MPPRRRRPAPSRTGPSRTSRSRSRTYRRRPRSTASTLGTAAGAAIAAVLATLLGGLPWWGWVLLVVVGLAAGLAYAAYRGRAATAAEPPPADDPVSGP